MFKPSLERKLLYLVLFVSNKTYNIKINTIFDELLNKQKTQKKNTKKRQKTPLHGKDYVLLHGRFYRLKGTFTRVSKFAIMELKTAKKNNVITEIR